VGGHPEVILPVNLDVQCDCPEVIDSQRSVDMDENSITPMHSLKESKSSPPWTEVVRGGKTRSKRSNISKNEMRTLES
jgi:hypothetical protein